MSIEYGIKIKNFQAASLYEYNLGVRTRYDYKKAILTNSLFSDFLQNNGLKLYKKTSTRDIIGIEFGYGTRSYEEEKEHLERLKEELPEKQKKLNPKDYNYYANKINQLLEDVEINKDKFQKLSKEQLRDIFYTQGVNVSYITRQKDGSAKKVETIHYKMLFRSTGKAKKGSCVFIRDELYEKAINYLRMGLKMPKENAPLVEISAYSPLVASTIVGKVHIDPYKELVVLKDFDSFTKENVVSVEVDENKHCKAELKENFEVKNTLFDGQALIDNSIFPSWGNGFVLLRQHFFKAAAFRTNIQQFFKDYYGDMYDSAYITDMFGVRHKVTDIKLITTDNACKFIKFNVNYLYWCDKVNANGGYFGIVKTGHKSKLGQVQRMSYQMVNSLDFDTMGEIVQPTVDYIIKLKTDDDIFLDYLKRNVSFANDYDVLYALAQQNRKIIQSDYFRKRRYSIIDRYVQKFKQGKVLQNADNLTIVGNPYAMLLYTVGVNPETDTTLQNGTDGAIGCYTERFGNGEYLAEFRSPFNGCNNMGYLYNTHNPIMQKYFPFGDMIIAVNLIHTDFQDRNNGSDEDSDMIYTTNQPQIVQRAKDCVKNYPTIVNNIPKSKKKYNNSLQSYSDIDNSLAHAQLAIGESSNLAQIALTYTYNFTDQKYKNYVCILSVLAQIAIDNAKRVYDIDLMNEINRIKTDMDIDSHGLPQFWSLTHRDVLKRKIAGYVGRPKFDEQGNNTGQMIYHFEKDKALKCPMDFLYTYKIPSKRSDKETIPFSNFFVGYKSTGERNKYKSQKVESFIEKYVQELNQAQMNESEAPTWLYIQNDFDEMLEDIRQLYISSNYEELYLWLLDKAFNFSNKNNSSIINKNKAALLKTLYTLNPNLLLKCFSKQ